MKSLPILAIVVVLVALGSFSEQQISANNDGLGLVNLSDDFSTSQGVNGIFYESYGDTRPSNVTNPSPATVNLLDFVGGKGIPNCLVTNTGPVYEFPSAFPYNLRDNSRSLLLMHPGTGGVDFGSGTANIGAAFTFVAPTTGKFRISGDFARANGCLLGGNGVDVAILKNLDAANPLFVTTISSNHAVDSDDPFSGTGVANFDLMVSLGQGDALRFVVFSDSQGQDGTFDVTAFRLKISGPSAVGGTTSFFMDDSNFSAGSIALVVSGVATASAILIGGSWYARRR